MSAALPVHAPTPVTPPVWRGAFVAEGLGVTIVDDPSRSVLPIRDLVGMALRRNPRRAHLLVSTVLAKHVPTRPWVAIAAGEVLGLAVAAALARMDDADASGRTGGTVAVGPAAHLDEAVRSASALLHEVLVRGDAPAAGSGAPVRAVIDAARPAPRPDLVTIGFAETATGLGSLVAGVLGSRTIHSTRLDPPGARVLTGFEEAHSHATDHRLMPTDPLLRPGGTVVLVDDELSTGATIVNTIRALHAVEPQAAWVVAALVDLRGAADRSRLADLAVELGTRIDVVALGSGTLTLPSDAITRAPGLIAELVPSGGLPSGDAPTGDLSTGDVLTAGGVAGGARIGAASVLDLTGVLPAVRSDRFGTAGGVSADLARMVAGALGDHLADAGSAIAGTVPPVRILVLGTEEHSALPLAVADALDAARTDADVRYSTTTRSPIVAADRDDYAITAATSFRSHDRTVDGPGVRHAYNLHHGGVRPDLIVVLPEPGTPAAAVEGEHGLVTALRRHADHVVTVLLAEELPTERTPA